MPQLLKNISRHPSDGFKATDQVNNQVIGLIYPSRRSIYFEAGSLEELYYYLVDRRKADPSMQWPLYVVMEDGSALPFLPDLFYLAFSIGAILESDLRQILESSIKHHDHGISQRTT